MMAYDDGSGPSLLIGDRFGVWKLQGPSITQLLTSSFVLRFRELELSGKRSIYAFALNGAYRQSGSTWERILGGNAGDGVVFDDGSGPALYVSSHNRVYRIDETATVIAELSPGICGLSALAVWDDGSAEKLYVGGFFTSVSGVAAQGIAAWDGNVWAPVGTGVSFLSFPFPGPCGAGIDDLLVFDDGRGEQLYAGGYFDHAGGAPAVIIARWDGVSWNPVGGINDYDVHDSVWRLRSMDNQGHSELWACGRFERIGGVDATAVAKWNGTNWEAPFAGLLPWSYYFAGDVVSLEDADGAALFVGGRDLVTGGGIEPPNDLLRYGCVCPDIDADGEVGISDLAVLLAHFGVSAVAWDAPGNVDHDRNVDLGDLVVLLAQIGFRCQ